METIEVQYPIPGLLDYTAYNNSDYTFIDGNTIAFVWTGEVDNIVQVFSHIVKFENLKYSNSILKSRGQLLFENGPDTTYNRTAIIRRLSSERIAVFISRNIYVYLVQDDLLLLESFHENILTNGPQMNYFGINPRATGYTNFSAKSIKDNQIIIGDSNIEFTNTSYSTVSNMSIKRLDYDINTQQFTETVLYNTNILPRRSDPYFETNTSFDGEEVGFFLEINPVPNTVNLYTLCLYYKDNGGNYGKTWIADFVDDEGVKQSEIPLVYPDNAGNPFPIQAIIALNPNLILYHGELTELLTIRDNGVNVTRFNIPQETMSGTFYADRDISQTIPFENGVYVILCEQGLLMIELVNRVVSNLLIIDEFTINQDHKMILTKIDEEFFVKTQFVNISNDAPVFNIKKYVAPIDLNSIPPSTGEPFFNNVTLLLQPTDTDVDIIDKSINNHSLSIINTFLTPSTEPPFSQAMFFTEQSVRRVVDVNSDTVMDFGTGDFTIETWIYPTVYDSGTNNYIIDTPTATPAFIRNGFSSGTGQIGLFSSIALVSLDYPLNQWVHVAVSRNSGTARLFINGDLKSTASMSDNFNVGSPISIGGVRPGNGGGFNFGDLMNSIRITSGVGRYTRNFSPPTDFLTNESVIDPYFSNVTLLLQPELSDTTVVDKSLLNNTITNSNIEFNADAPASALKSLDLRGSSVVKTIRTTGSIFDFGINEDFTYEFWLRVEVFDTDNFNTLMDTTGAVRTVLARSGGFIPPTDGTLYFDEGAATIRARQTYPVQEWFHLAISRNLNTLRVFINGEVVETVSSNRSYSGITEVIFGSLDPFNDPSRNFDGLVGSIRFTGNVARYTTNFTPQTKFPTQ